MTDYFEAPDGHGESCIWIPDGDRPKILLCRSDLWEDDARYWPDVVARLTSATITNNAATVDRVAQVILEYGGSDSLHSWRCKYPERYGPCSCIEETARAILAALTGVPHD
jgi:hypothetical protein